MCEGVTRKEAEEVLIILVSNKKGRKDSGHHTLQKLLAQPYRLHTGNEWHHHDTWLSIPELSGPKLSTKVGLFLMYQRGKRPCNTWIIPFRDSVNLSYSRKEGGSFKELGTGVTFLGFRFTK